MWRSSFNARRQNPRAAWSWRVNGQAELGDNFGYERANNNTNAATHHRRHDLRRIIYSSKLVLRIAGASAPVRRREAAPPAPPAPAPAPSPAPAPPPTPPPTPPKPKPKVPVSRVAGLWATASRVAGLWATWSPSPPCGGLVGNTNTNTTTTDLGP